MKTNQNAGSEKEMDVDVLYQKLGDRWFAFSLVGDEVFMTPISDEVIQSLKSNPNTTPRNSDETV